MRKFSQRSLKNLEGIHPDLLKVVEEALQSSPLDFVVIEGRRTLARQKMLKEQGLSRTLNSRHLHGLAVDLWPIDPLTNLSAVSGDGALDRATAKARDARLHELFDILGPAVKAAAKKVTVPITWGGDWTTFIDKPHFELPPGIYPDNVEFKAKPIELVAPAPKPVALPEPQTSSYLSAGRGEYVCYIDEMGIRLVPKK